MINKRCKILYKWSNKNDKIELTEQEKEGLTEDEIEIALARKLEIVVLPHIKRNINFFYAGANIPVKSKAYNQRVNETELKQAIEGKKEAIPTSCRRLCKMVAQILRDNGLNAHTVTCDTDIFRHTDVLLTTSSGKQYIINYLEDAENIQTGMKTPDFASKQYYERRYKKFEGGETTVYHYNEDTDSFEEEKMAAYSEGELDERD